MSPIVRIDFTDLFRLTSVEGTSLAGDVKTPGTETRQAREDVLVRPIHWGRCRMSQAKPLSLGLFVMPIHDPAKPLSRCIDEDL